MHNLKNWIMRKHFKQTNIEQEAVRLSKDYKLFSQLNLGLSLLSHTFALYL